jgi:UDP-4-amino-4,6-dideoxy-N-acetyl-beta-L-altrosamine transaminase
VNFIQYGKQSLDEDDIKSVVDVLRSDFLTTGPKVLEFEEAFSCYCGAKYTVCVSSGTAALHLTALCMLDKNDKVLTTPNSFVATANSILYADAKPIFVDIQKDGNIDLDLCEEMLELDGSIKAIFVVAISGNMVNQEKLKRLKKKYGILILEDCSHAIGAKDGDVRAGSCTNSDCCVFSFHPVKHITTGEGGAITTNSKEIYEKLLRLRGHGMHDANAKEPWRKEMVELGFNYRISDIGCALGISQLKKVDYFLDRRLQIAKIYDDAFVNHPNIKPLYNYTQDSSYHLYIVRVDFTKQSLTKEQLFTRLFDKNIGIQLHYTPINKQPYYKSLGFGSESTPIMDLYYKESLSLPIYPTLTDKEQEYVVETILRLLS